MSEYGYEWDDLRDYLRHFTRDRLRRWSPFFKCSTCGWRRKWNHDRSVEHPPMPAIMRLWLDSTKDLPLSFDDDEVKISLHWEPGPWINFEEQP